MGTSRNDINNIISMNTTEISYGDRQTFITQCKRVENATNLARICVFKMPLTTDAA
ncbi:hypothetical protein PAXINDRAFT_167921 [Paxillus involutus ATCC 200175]|nr:hypothetical protein PAXINDRAFT_167921 [Paxillus involutus ATCC 200175]